MGMVEKETRGFLGVLVCLFFFFGKKVFNKKIRLFVEVEVFLKWSGANELL